MKQSHRIHRSIPGAVAALLLLAPVVAWAQAPPFILAWGGWGSGDTQMQLPVGVAVDANGHVFVSDNGNMRIQKFTGTGAFIAKWGSFGTGAGQFDMPNAVAVDASGSVYVADGHNHRIQKFTNDGVFMT
jgi:DNA-binding beta-propeller fold protein YncE